MQTRAQRVCLIAEKSAIQKRSTKTTIVPSPRCHTARMPGHTAANTQPNDSDTWRKLNTHNPTRDTRWTRTVRYVTHVEHAHSDTWHTLNTHNPIYNIQWTRIIRYVTTHVEYAHSDTWHTLNTHNPIRDTRWTRAIQYVTHVEHAQSAHEEWRMKP